MPKAAHKKARRSRAEQRAAAPTQALEQSESAELSIEGPALAAAGGAARHAVALHDPRLREVGALQRARMVQQLQRGHGNGYVARELARAHEPAAPIIARKEKLPAIDARRKLTPADRALVESYWARRRADPAWADQFHKIVDHLFWKDTGYKVGKPLDPRLAADRPFCEIWLQTRDKIMGQFKGDPINDALVLMRHSPALIERNTAEAVDAGKLKTFYIEDCQVDPKSDEKLAAAGRDKSLWVTLLHPVTKESMFIQRNAAGFTWAGVVFAKRATSIKDMRAFLTHETNHALNPDAESDKDPGGLARYKNEFQAYWVAPPFSDEPDLDKRADGIKTHILADYPLLKAKYDADADFKDKVDKVRRPNRNVINSLRWTAIEQNLNGSKPNTADVFKQLEAMPPEERAFVRADPNFMAMLRAHLDVAEHKKAVDILYG